MDFDDKNCIDFEKAFKFNKYMEENVNDNMASKDANDFISSCAICNKQTVIFSIFFLIFVLIFFLTFKINLRLI